MTQRVIAKEKSQKKQRPPKKWFDKMKKEIKKNSPEYSEEQIAATIGDIWFHNLTEKKRKQISKRDRVPEKKASKERTRKQLDEVAENIHRLKERDDITEEEAKRLSFLLKKEIELQKELEKESSLRRDSMLAKLFKVAYKLDKDGLYDEARAIDEVVADLAQRVGLRMQPEDLVSIASFLDEQGDTKLASQFDDMLDTMAKTKERSSDE